MSEIVKSENQHMKQIEVNGIKFEVDMRHAKKVDYYRVGDPVKVLKREYQDDWKSYTGVIADFIPFENKPTIVVAYLSLSYSEAEIHFIHITPDNQKDIEIAPMSTYETDIKKEDFLSSIDRQIEGKKEAVKELEYKKRLFLDHFGRYFGEFKDEL